MPVIRLNNVVLPAPLGPMMALRSPGITRSVTSRVACTPPKLLHTPLRSSAGTPPFVCVSLTQRSLRLETPEPLVGAPAPCRLFAELAGRIVAVIDRMRQELLLALGPELVDLRIGLDHDVPQLRLVVAEHLLLLDLLDVDVLDRVTHVVEFDRAARCVELDARHDLDELFRSRPLAAGLLDRLVDPHGGRVVVLRVIARHLAEL